MIRAVLFDLDDTLYPEREYYLSGFAVVARELHCRGVAPVQAIGDLLAAIHFRESRRHVFDKAARRLGFPEHWVPELVALFHAHRPQLRLPHESRDVLARLRRTYRVGIVTDGHAQVQRAKIAALGVAALVDAVTVADDLGREHWKPHPLPFWICCRDLEVDPAEAVFVGDNPQRDVLGARNAEMTGIRLRRPGGYFYARDEYAEAADEEIRSLAELHAVMERLRMKEPVP